MKDQVQVNSNQGTTKLSFVPNYHALNNEGQWQLSKRLRLGKSTIELNMAVAETRAIQAEGGNVELPEGPMDLLLGHFAECTLETIQVNSLQTLTKV